MRPRAAMIAKRVAPAAGVAIADDSNADVCSTRAE
jgi:hypothetical protein